MARIYGGRSMGSYLAGAPRAALRGPLGDYYLHGHSRPHPRTRAQLGSLGDDTLDAQSTFDDVQWKKDMLAEAKAQVVAHETWAAGDRLQKWIAIAATVSIPVFSVIWKKLGVIRSKKKAI